MIPSAVICGALTIYIYAFFIIAGNRNFGKSSWLVGKKRTAQITTDIKASKPLTEFSPGH